MSKHSYDISYTPSSGKRQTLRARIANVSARFEGRAGTLTVRDLSPTGMAVDGSRGFEVGMETRVTLLHGRTELVRGLPARVVRKEVAFTGLAFGRLSRAQQDKVHEFVLQEQKRLADIRRADKRKAG